MMLFILVLEGGWRGKFWEGIRLLKHGSAQKMVVFIISNTPSPSRSCTYNQGFRIRSVLTDYIPIVCLHRLPDVTDVTPKLSLDNSWSWGGKKTRPFFSTLSAPALQHYPDLLPYPENWNALALCFQNKHESSFPALPVFTRFIPGAWLWTRLNMHIAEIKLGTTEMLKEGA